MLSVVANNIDLSKYTKYYEQYFARIQPKVEKTNTPIYYPFQLPITYLDASMVHPLSKIVCNDLELNTPLHANKKCMYDYLLKPKHQFANQMIQEWSKQFTTDIMYLSESQRVIMEHPEYLNRMKETPYNMDCENIMSIWKSLKEDDNFLDKYCYMEWEILEYLNHSSPFLQTLSVINLLSPLTSLIVPIILLIFPFILLKIQSIPITFDKYVDVLKTLAKNHFIGKSLLSMKGVSFQNFGYVFITLGLYLLQIYQNFMSCIRFYKNTRKINNDLCDMKAYLKYSIQSLDAFTTIHANKVSYSKFCSDARKHRVVLQRLHSELDCIQPFRLSFFKLNEIGYMLKCYYQIFINPEYDQSIRYSIGFEGYINNLSGIHENMCSNAISCAEFIKDNETDIQNHYYPPFSADNTENIVKNDCHFDKNMIITGVNASGKTTILKSTMLNIIFTQQFGCGYYESCVLNPYTYIHSYLNIPDTSERDSLFQAESRRCKEIIDIIHKTSGDGSRHFCIFDELYSGTNPIEATKSAYAFLAYMSKYKQVDFILTTHYTSMCKKIKSCKRIRNYKMDVQKNDDENLIYTYKLKPGICNIQGAIEILKNMEYPPEIINTIKTYKV